MQTRESIWKHIEQLAAQGKEANPFVVLTSLMLDSDDQHIRVSCAVALADRLLPKLKAVEVSGDPEHPIRMLMEQLEHFSDSDMHRLLYPEGKPLGLPHEPSSH